MKSISAKISLILLTFVLFSSCNAVKRVESDEHLLIENTIFLDSVELKDKTVYNQLYQEPNSTLLGFPLELHIFNLAKPNPDSTFNAWLHKKPRREERLINLLSKKQVERLGDSYVSFNEWIKKTGEAPVIASEGQAERSAERLKAYYWNQGWFDVETDFTILEQENKRAKVEYYVSPKKPYIVDTISTRIASIVADSIYEVHKGNSAIRSGIQYKTIDINKERERLTSLFRNNGLYHFEQEYITFEADTIGTDNKVNTSIIIQNQEATIDGASTRIPYKVHKISRVNIFPDYTFENRNKVITDTTSFEGYHIYGFDNIKYRPSALTDAVFITPGSIYSDDARTMTYNRINQLRIFKYPNIQYMEDPEDSTGTNLISNIFLTALPKYSLGFEFDLSQSNIQKFGIGFGGSLLIRNILGGAEILEISGRGSVGSSKDAAGNDDQFFNISEIGTDIKLTLPRIFFPVSTEKFIPKYMHPFTSFSVGASTQTNIGLDKRNLTTIMNYRWQPSDSLSHQLDLINVQYVRNLNIGNYFNVYRNSFEELNQIATSGNVLAEESYFTTTENGNRVLSIPVGAENFLADTQGNDDFGLTPGQVEELNDIRERKLRLTEDNLIFASNFSYILNKKENLYDEDFSRLRIKLESAGNFLQGLSKLTNLEKDRSGRYSISGVNFSQYIKTEIDYIKHWDLGSENVVAIRTFGGIAIPYGNSNSIPFSRSFFAGGANDNRAWQAYSLGPGSSGGRNEFNEANLKIALSAEYRYNLFGSLNSAFFVDIGNIWNVLDVVEEEAATFTSLSDLHDIAVGSGFGLRYDFDFFVLRFDVGFKTYDPSRPIGNRWFKDYNFANAVYNVGINYPF